MIACLHFIVHWIAARTPFIRAAGVVALLLASSGCGGRNYTPPPASDPAQARATLVEVLEAWKAEAAPESLRDGRDPVYVGDEDWSRGEVLRSFDLQGDGVIYGHNVRFDVDLQLASRGKRSVHKAVRFVVSTVPIRSVLRDDSVE